MLIHKNLLKTILPFIRFHQKASAFTFATKDQKERVKAQRYFHPYNFNREEYKGYIKKVQKANKMIDLVEEKQSKSLLPRRKRRIYDKPRFDIDTTNYGAWRLFEPEETFMKFHEHALPVNAKLQLQPKWVVHAFGLGLFPQNHQKSVDREYVFEDTNLSTFLLYEYRNTTSYKKNDAGFDYENQEHLRPGMRKVLRLSPEQFWQSEEYFEFRLNSTCYSEFMKFSTWLKETIEKRKSEESFDGMIDKKCGEVCFYNEKGDEKNFKAREPFVKYVSPESYAEKKGQKPAKGKKQSKQEKITAEAHQTKANFKFSRHLEERYRVRAQNKAKSEKEANQTQ